MLLMDLTFSFRPLPEELIKYAREDTHYLLYLYDRARNDLIERSNEQGNLLQSVVQRSKQICMKVCRSEVKVRSMYTRSQVISHPVEPDLAKQGVI